MASTHLAGADRGLTARDSIVDFVDHGVLGHGILGDVATEGPVNDGLRRQLAVVRADSLCVPSHVCVPHSTQCNTRCQMHAVNLGVQVRRCAAASDALLG